MVKTESDYHNSLCKNCNHYFHGYKGLVLHLAMSRCGRIKSGRLSTHDIIQIRKYPGRYRNCNICICGKSLPFTEMPKHVFQFCSNECKEKSKEDEHE